MLRPARARGRAHQALLLEVHAGHLEVVRLQWSLRMLRLRLDIARSLDHVRDEDLDHTSHDSGEVRRNVLVIQVAIELRMGQLSLATPQPIIRTFLTTALLITVLRNASNRLPCSSSNTPRSSLSHQLRANWRAHRVSSRRRLAFCLTSTVTWPVAGASSSSSSSPSP